APLPAAGYLNFIASYGIVTNGMISPIPCQTNIMAFSVNAGSAYSSPNTFAPYLWMFAYEVFHHLHAFFRVQIENPYPSRTEPVEAAAKCSALAYDQCADAELTHQAAAVPAGRQCSHHHNIAVGT